jgi:ABC-type transport system substrate-binding protein
VDRLFQEGRRERDPVKRRGVYQQIVDIVQEDAPYAVFATPAIIRAYKRELSISRVYANGIFLQDISWK